MMPSCVTSAISPSGPGNRPKLKLRALLPHLKALSEFRIARSSFAYAASGIWAATSLASAEDSLASFDQIAANFEDSLTLFEDLAANLDSQRNSLTLFDQLEAGLKNCKILATSLLEEFQNSKVEHFSVWPSRSPFGTPFSATFATTIDSTLFDQAFPPSQSDPALFDYLATSPSFSIKIGSALFEYPAETSSFPEIDSTLFALPVTLASQPNSTLFDRVTATIPILLNADGKLNADSEEAPRATIFQGFECGQSSKYFSFTEPHLAGYPNV
jgi:hypothetical protein